MENLYDDYVPSFKFFKIQKSNVKLLKQNQSMICFIDISQKIFYDNSKAQSDMLSIINSTISHEMRNPLNSITNECTIIAAFMKMLLDKIQKNESILHDASYEEIIDVIENV